MTHNIHEALILSDRLFLMSAYPGTIVKEFSIDLPRPRDVYEVRNSPKYAELLHEINTLLLEEVKKSQTILETCMRQKTT